MESGPAPGPPQGEGPLLFARSETRPGCGQEQAPPFFASARKHDLAGGHSRPEKNVDTTTRKPMFLFRLPGLFLLRYAARTFLELLLNAPPRTTRWVRACPSVSGPS